jgi:O-antigen/teichoic acid export membrane protein
VIALKSILAVRKYLQWHSFDLSSEEGRTAERYRLPLWSVIANVFSKGVAMLVMVLSVSLTLPYLGPERFGVWMTIASFVGMLVFLDLGIGNALTNHVASIAVQGKKEQLAQTISGGLGFLFIVGLSATAVLCTLTAILPWQVIIKVKDPLIRDEILKALYLFSVLFGINLFGLGVQKVFAGLQRSFEAHVVSGLSSTFSLTILWWVAREHAGITVLLLATLGCQSLGGFMLLGLLKRRSLFQLQGIWCAIAIEKNSLLKIGGLFFVLQIGTMVGWGADSLIISGTVGPSQVAVFSVVQRLFQFISIPLAMANAPLWSAYADAHSRGENTFIRKTLIRSITWTTAGALLGGLFLCLIGNDLIKFWTGGTIIPALSLVYIYFIWTMCETIGNSFAMMMNGCGVVVPQVIAVLIFVILAVPLKLLLIHYGLQWFVFATIFSYILSVPIFYIFLLKMGRLKVFK